MTKALPKDLTSYDFLKAAAVILMVIDHIGYYFYPDELWLRVIGRMCVPIWFFLIGYARSRDLGPKLWIGSALLVLGNAVSGMYIFPLNILPTMILIRLLIDPMMEQAKKSVSNLWSIATLLFLVAIPTSIITEYGTLALIMAMYGYIARHKEELGNIRSQYDGIVAYCLISFVIIQYLSFGFNGPSFWSLCAVTFASMAALYYFKPATYPGLTKKLPGIAVKPIRFLGRYTLEIYVVHLLAFKGLAMVFNPQEYSFWDWGWISL